MIIFGIICNWELGRGAETLRLELLSDHCSFILEYLFFLLADSYHNVLGITCIEMPCQIQWKILSESCTAKAVRPALLYGSG